MGEGCLPSKGAWNESERGSREQGVGRGQGEREEGRVREKELLVGELVGWGVERQRKFGGRARREGRRDGKGKKARGRE